MEEEVPIVARDDSGRIVKEFLALHGPPAYIRRARQVEEAFEQLLARCRQQRAELVEPVRRRLAAIGELSTERLQRIVRDEDMLLLRHLQADLQPSPAPLDSATSVRQLRRAVRELIESIEHFNRRWQAFLAGIDLGPVNALRENYNRWYVFEKECAVRSARVAQHGFRKLEPLTRAELAQLLPTLPSPRRRG